MQFLIIFVASWTLITYVTKAKKYSNTISYGAGFIGACVISVLAAVLLNAYLSDKKPQVKTPAPSFINAGNLKEISLDVVYAWQDDFTKNATPNMQLSVKKLQYVLNAWPAAQQTSQEPCYMQLRNETARILNLIDGLAAQDINDQPDYKLECRQSINYQYDKARTHTVWLKI